MPAMTEDDVGRIGGFVGMVAKRTRVSLLRVIICGRAPNVSDADGSPTSEYLVETQRQTRPATPRTPLSRRGRVGLVSLSVVLLDVVADPTGAGGGPTLPLWGRVTGS
jgi:hypothetical protein